MIRLYVIYIANCIVAGWIGITATFFPKTAAVTVFQNTYVTTEVMRLVGCLWLAIVVLSLLGLYRPLAFSPVLVLQLIYKGTWLLVVALPAIKAQQAYPMGMAGFFLVWVLVLPFVIPWSTLLK